MADDEEYDEVEAVVRIPKGERLADSRKTEGWSRGFTPKSTDKGPEHVEIRLKDGGDSQSVQEPEVIYVTEYVEAPRPPERSMAEQAALDFLRRVIEELIEAAKPHVAHWWNTHVIPAMRAKRDDFLLKRQARKANKMRRAKATTTTLIAEQAAEVSFPRNRGDFLNAVSCNFRCLMTTRTYVSVRAAIQVVCAPGPGNLLS